MAESEFEAFLEHLKKISEDIEQMHSAFEMVEKLKIEVTELLKSILRSVNVSSLAIPSTFHGEIDSASLDRSGMLVAKSKKGPPAFTDLKDLPSETVIKVFNVLVPVLREEISTKRRTYEKHLEAFQAIKDSLGKIEKRRP